MTSYLYVLSIGPVQGFIAAARRTRDLWIGSHLLSEISKAAAKEIARSEGATLIFPALKANDIRLDPLNDPDAYNVANIILAKLDLPEGRDPSSLNKNARKAAQGEWEQYANGARYLAEHLSNGSVDQTIWKDQVNDVIEFYSAWVPLGNNDYPEKRKRLMRLLAARKATRDFKTSVELPKIPKSSFDGARERVLLRSNEMDKSKELALKMRLQAGEQLCAIGLTKRLGGIRSDQMSEKNKILLEVFPSVVRVALDPWIRGILNYRDEASHILENIKNICMDNLNHNGNISQGTGKVYYQEFPFDGQVLYLSRISSMIRAHENDRGKIKRWETYLSERDIGNLKKIKDLSERLQKSGKNFKGEQCLGLGEPQRYYAVLIADGDRMGKTISASSMKNPDDHIKFSSKLAEFAGIARKIVKRNHGCMVYSGGDDVLAFLPLDTCLHAASVLHRAFGILLDDFPDENGKTPTLSVGIAIGHSMEPLEDILGFARDAESAAKKGEGAKDERDGLAVHIYPRSGVPIKIREQWKARNENGLDERLLKWAKMHCRDELPDRAAYDLRELAEDYRNWSASTEVEKKALGGIIYADALRLLKRKRTGHGGEAIKEEIVKDFKEMLSGVDSYEMISKLANELIIARRLASAIEQANRKPHNNEYAEVES